MGDLTKNFSRSEFTCKCGCGLDDIDIEFVKKLQELRDTIGPMQVVSGLRCLDYNKKVGGVSNSAHMRGRAADIAVSDGVRRYWLLRKSLELGFIGVGVHKRFIHLDIDGSLVRPALWLY